MRADEWMIHHGRVTDDDGGRSEAAPQAGPIVKPNPSEPAGYAISRRRSSLIQMAFATVRLLPLFPFRPLALFCGASLVEPGIGDQRIVKP
jgi:hypothetical protein